MGPDLSVSGGPTQCLTPTEKLSAVITGGWFLSDRHWGGVRGTALREDVGGEGSLLG